MNRLIRTLLMLLVSMVTSVGIAVAQQYYTISDTGSGYTLGEAQADCAQKLRARASGMFPNGYKIYKTWSGGTSSSLPGLGRTVIYVTNFWSITSG